MKKITKKLKKKPDLVSKIVERKQLSLSVVSLAVDEIFHIIERALLKGRKVELRGFGSFGVKNYKAYKGRNPKNQHAVTVLAKKAPWFKPGLFQNFLNKK